MSAWRDHDLEWDQSIRDARFRLGERVIVEHDLVVAYPEDATHQPRLRVGTQAIITSLMGPPGRATRYRLGILEADGHPSGYWHEVDGRHLREARPKGVLTRLLKRLAGRSDDEKITIGTWFAAWFNRR